ncbi:MAG: hypothetical protein JXA42_24260 [Anaerolineales bacterium]|nr:hypothetical protein [Anaerolineales bacterium]
MQFTYTRNKITADFFTESFRISCQIGVPAGGLHSLLIDPLNSYLELEDTYISRINTPGSIVAHYDFAAIRKENMLFIILPRREDGEPPKGTGSFLRPVSRMAFITIPSFEIRGQVETEAKASPREILVHTTGRYVPIYDATASVAMSPGITFGGKIILINKEQIEALCIAGD